MKKIYTSILVLLCSMNVFAADFYWVGGNGSWSDFQHHWALSSGGSVFQTTVPSAFDNVFFDVNSFPTANDTMVTINTAVASTKNITFTTGVKKVKIQFNSNTLMQVYGSAVFPEQLTLLNQPRIYFKSTTSGNQLTFNKSKWTNASLIFDGIGGSWDVVDSLSAASFITLVNGDLNTNNKKVTCYSFTSNNSNNRTWRFSNSKLYIQNININTENLTQVSNASCLHTSRVDYAGLNKLNIDTMYVFDQYGANVEGLSVKIMYGGSISIENSLVEIININTGRISIQTSTVSTLYLTNGSMTIDPGISIVHEAHLINVSLIQIKGTFELENFTLSGNTCAKRIQWTGTAGGTLKKTTGSFTFDNALISDLIVSGGALFNTSNSYDLGGNSGINFTTPVSKTYYWIGDDGDIKDPLHWSLSSGGTADGCIPTVYDDVILDHNSFNSGTSHYFSSISCKTIHTVELDEQVNVNDMIVTGSAYLSPLFRLYETVNFSSGLSGNEIDLNGATITGEHSEIVFNGTGDWTLIDSMYAYTIRQNSGSLHSEGWNIHATDMSQIGGDADFSHSTIVIDETIYTQAIVNTSKIIFPHGGSLATEQRVGEVISYLKTLRVTLGTISKLTSHGDLLLQQLLEIDTLLIDEGINVSFSVYYNPMELQVDSIGILPSNLGCGRLTIFQTVEGNGYANITKTSGTLTLKNTVLTNIHASGGAAFIADQCADLGNNTGWTFHALTPKTYYWINNGGQWEDPSHWSLSSGGPSAGCIPAVQDKVVLDNQSFDQPNQLISKTKPEVQLSGFMAQNIPPGTALAISQYEIYGNVEFTPNLYTTNCYLSIKGKKSTLKTNGKFIDQVNTTTDSLELLDDLYCEGLSVVRGFVKLKGRRLTTEGIGFDASEADTLIVNMEDCEIFAQGMFICLDKLNMNAGESVVMLAVGKNPNQDILKVVSHDFVNTPLPLHLNKVKIYQSVAMPITPSMDISFDYTIINELQIDTSEIPVFFNMNASEIKNLYVKPNCLASGLKIGMAQFYGNVQTYGNSYIDYLRLEPGTQLSIRSGDSIIVHEYLDAVGNSSFPITIDAMTNGSKAFIKCLSGSICCSYLNLSNIAATGGANFYAGLSSNNVYNNTGWNFGTNCEVLNIAAKIPGCEGKALDLQAVHPASITGFLWSGPNSLISNSDNIHIASLSNKQTGLYTLQAGGQTRKLFVTQEAKQDSAIVNYNNTSIGFRNNIINTMLGYSVSWYKDDQLIDGEFSSGIPSYGEGTYYARYTTPAGCDYQSNSVVVTNSTTDPVVLYAPYNLTASLNSQGKVQLTWSDINTSENGFKVYRSTSPDNGFVFLASTGQSTLTYTDPANLSAGTYYYKVLAFAGSGPDVIVSDFSNVTSISLTILSNQSSTDQNQIAIRPIPVQDVLTIESAALPLTHIIIYDQLGAIHLNQNIDQLQSLQLDLSKLPQGAYILKINTTESEIYRRFVK